MSERKEEKLVPARLLIAAGDLYGALEQAERLYSRRDLIANSPECGEWINRTRAALAKARGE